MPTNSYEKTAIGDNAFFTKTISETDIYLYAGITGDFNPAHVNEEFARTTSFGRRIAHGMLLGGLISNVLGNQLPGNGSIYISQTLAFLSPVYIGDTITVKVEVIEKRDEKRRIVCRTSCNNQKGTLVADGEAVISPPRS